MNANSKVPDAAARFDAVVVGAGFAGLYMVYKLRELGLSVQGFEAGAGVGGTWYWNRYPGARCDIESLEYSYSFSRELEQEWRWTERYASQPEILAYLENVANRFDLHRSLSFDTRVTSAGFDEAEGRWLVTSDRGDHVSTRFLILATGCLSAPRLPDIDGLESFAGQIYQTARWPHDGVRFDGQRVAVVGTGSSAVQSIPMIARQAAHLTVFQRTPCYSVPARNRPLDSDEQASFKANSPAIRHQMRTGMTSFAGIEPGGPTLEASVEERAAAFEANWEKGGISFMFTYGDALFDAEANEVTAEFLRGKIASLVADPETAAKLTPRTYPAFTKRLCLDSGYFETFNLPDVTLVDISETPIEEVTSAGIRAGTTLHTLDSIVFATGFDAVTGAALSIDIIGKDGQRLADKWAEGPKTYLGLMTAGFPNLFFVTGPGSPSVLSNMVLSIEQHVDWIAACIADMDRDGAATIEAGEAAQEAWVAHVNELAATTLFPKAASWYMGANVPGKPRVFMPYVAGVGPYRQKCDEVVAKGYEGFEVRSLAPA
jgi:cyclohexanone monooxygenase